MLNLEKIDAIAQRLDLQSSDYEQYGNFKAKLNLDLLNRNRKGKLILMTAMSPTPSGEGKTTMNIGLSMALNRLGYRAISALREPSLGPVFGMKGGATGGGKATIEPSMDINLHFTGDIHAITSAHNLLATIIDNHIFQGNSLNFNPDTLQWHRVVDMNDRALRIVDLKHRKSRFDITAASEIMAIICLAEDYKDLKVRLGRILVGYNLEGAPIFAHQLQCVDALMLLLKDALRPNLVQTSEGTPAIVHGGPFANIAHGCNSVIGTKMALTLADYVVTEAGFGADLGAQKFFDIKCAQSNIKADAIVIVATLKSIKYHGGLSLKDLDKPSLSSLEIGFENLKRHIENMKIYHDNVVVALNQFVTDSQEELTLLESLCNDMGINLLKCNVFLDGGEGANELAKAVIGLCENSNPSRNLGTCESIEESLTLIAKKIYRAENVFYSDKAKIGLERAKALGVGHYPVCIAKTQYSFTDDPKRLNAPNNFDFKIDEIRISNGAGFVVAIAGTTMTMPGLPKEPNAINMKFDSE